MRRRLALLIVFCLSAGSSPIQSQLTVVQKLTAEAASLQEVLLALPETPSAVFLEGQDSEAGVGLVSDNVVLLYERKVHEINDLRLPIRIVLDAQSFRVSSATIQFATLPTQPSIRQEEILTKLGAPSRKFRVRIVDEEDDREAKLGDCEDPSGTDEIWLYPERVAALLLSPDPQGSMVPITIMFERDYADPNAIFRPCKR